MDNKKELFAKEKQKKEENPFENERVSQEWIRSVEGEKDMTRDKEIYPRLKNWIEESQPRIVVEIGAGQGICSSKMGDCKCWYIGIEPSAHLVNRANELYKTEGRDFIIGNAYKLPIKSESVDASFSINVWFHLENLGQASRELARILMPGRKFMIVTANPKAYKIWESWYFDAEKDGKKIVGKVNVPVNPLSENILYQHTLDEITEALKDNNLEPN